RRRGPPGPASSGPAASPRPGGRRAGAGRTVGETPPDRRHRRGGAVRASHWYSWLLPSDSSEGLPSGSRTSLARGGGTRCSVAAGPLLSPHVFVSRVQTGRCRREGREKALPPGRGGVDLVHTGGGSPFGPGPTAKHSSRRNHDGSVAGTGQQCCGRVL